MLGLFIGKISGKSKMSWRTVNPLLEDVSCKNFISFTNKVLRKHFRKQTKIISTKEKKMGIKSLKIQYDFQELHNIQENVV